ncbi:MAG: aldo/keto reductase, partial [Candidatus Latescibacteria bacterium]|nr:aldo/keto reductase [Candidatus Latescibacterota bacterium]
MRYRKLGRTDIEVSEVGFGAWAVGGGFELGGSGIGYGPTDDATSISAVYRAVDLGVTLIDTADAYGAGHSEELLGEALGGRWDGINLATKVGNERCDPLPGRKNFGRDYIFEACERSLTRLKKDVIDVYQLHNPPPEVFSQDDVWTTLADLRQQGKIRFVGMSISDPPEGVELISSDRVDVLQIHYNILTRHAEAELLPLCKKQNIGTLIRVPMASGLLGGNYTKDTVFPSTDHRGNWLKDELLSRAIDDVDAVREAIGGDLSMAEAALRFVLENPAVSCVIPGAKTPHQVDANIAASADTSLLGDGWTERIRQA